MITLWQLDGKIVAMLNLDNPGEAFFQIHPAFCVQASVAEMLDVAEQKLRAIKAVSRQELVVWVNGNDRSAKELFTQRGYKPTGFSAEHMRRALNQPIPEAASRDGYTVRALGEESEHPARSWLSWKVFHPDEPDERYQGFEWYKNVQRIPLYRRDLDLVAVAPDGELAAFCTVWFDDVTRTAVFGPVGTHPDHQKQGLGKAVMSEGLRHARRLGATLAIISSYSTGAHPLYHSMGCTEFDLLEPWIKAW